jgi:Mg2+ and Co2+ transporter CorA
MTNHHAADYLDDMSDRAYEIEEAMREAEQSDFSYIETMEELNDNHD